jgi:quercetin dioxygenase-like cupin family protein
MALPNVTATLVPTTIAATVPCGDGFITLAATAKQTHGQFRIVDFLILPGQEPPLHVHDRQDELFYVLEGQVDFILDTEVTPHGQGGSVNLPRGIPHGFRVRSARAHLLSIFTPGGFEEYFRKAGGVPDVDLVANYRCRFVG